MRLLELSFPHLPRYIYRRVSGLPVTDEGIRRYVELSGSDALPHVTIRHTVMQPGGEVPVGVDDVGQLFITISGRGVMLLDGDRIEVDIPGRRINLLVPVEELAARRRAWTCPAPRVARGFLSLYARLAEPAERGAGLPVRFA